MRHQLKLYACLSLIATALGVCIGLVATTKALASTLPHAKARCNYQAALKGGPIRHNVEIYYYNEQPLPPHMYTMAYTTTAATTWRSVAHNAHFDITANGLRLKLLKGECVQLGNVTYGIQDLNGVNGPNINSNLAWDGKGDLPLTDYVTVGNSIYGLPLERIEVYIKQPKRPETVYIN